MKTALLLAVLTTAATFAADPADPMPDQQARYRAFMNSHKAKRTKEIDDLISTKKIELAKAKKARAKNEIKELTAGIAKLTAEQAAFKNAKEVVPPFAALDSVQVGDFGKITGLVVTVKMVLDKKKMLAVEHRAELTFSYKKGARYGPPKEAGNIIIRNVDTSKLADGSPLGFGDKIFECVATETVGMSTYFVLEPVAEAQH